VELQPRYWANWNSLGALLLRRGDYAGARAAFEHIVKLVPGKNRGYEQLAAIECWRAATSRRSPSTAAAHPGADGDLASTSARPTSTRR